MSTVPLSNLLEPLFQAADMPDQEKIWAENQFTLLTTGKTVTKLENQVPAEAIAYLTKILREDPKPQTLEELFQILSLRLPQDEVEIIKQTIEDSLVETYEQLASVVLSEATPDQKKVLANNLLTLRSSITP